jgi:hypothetical protein
VSAGLRLPGAARAPAYHCADACSEAATCIAGPPQPSAAKRQEYEATPVDEFAKALLRGMGWRDGEGVGRSKAAVEVKQIVPRPERLGLGADPAALPQHLQRPRVVKMGACRGGAGRGAGGGVAHAARCTA